MPFLTANGNINKNENISTKEQIGLTGLRAETECDF